jgi:hypothetical protein
MAWSQGLPVCYAVYDCREKHTEKDSNSPYGERRIGALTAIKARAPVLGGNFGVWGGLFSTFDCAVKGIRCAMQKHRTLQGRGADYATGRRKIRGMLLSAASSLEALSLYVVVLKPCVTTQSVAPFYSLSLRASALRSVE